MSEENDSLGMLQTPMTSYFGLRSPVSIKSSFDSSTTVVNGTTTFACNGGHANPALSEKSLSLSNVDVYHNSPPSPSEQPPTSPYLCNGHQKHHWRHSPMRSSTILPNGMIPRQQTTIDETVVINGDNHEISINGADRTLRPTENGVGLCDFPCFSIRI